MVEGKTYHMEAKIKAQEYSFIQSGENQRKGDLTGQGGYSNPHDMLLAMVDCHYSGEGPDITPKTVVSAGVYACCLVFNVKKTQLEVANEFDTSKTTVQNHYEYMMDLVIPDRNDWER